ncbi:hypothetical protein GCM10023237_26220 [Streptomyces coeruleoprunus]
MVPNGLSTCAYTVMSGPFLTPSLSPPEPARWQESDMRQEWAAHKAGADRPSSAVPAPVRL